LVSSLAQVGLGGFLFKIPSNFGKTIIRQTFLLGFDNESRQKLVPVVAQAICYME
jgi:hypothetical protein